MAPQISIVIPFLRSSRGLTTLLPAIQSCLAQSIAADIHLVSNFPDEPLARALQALASPRLKLSIVGAAGVNRARNFGARLAQTKFILFLDDDCLLPRKNFLSELIAGLTRDPSIAALGGGYDSPPSAGWKTRGYNALATSWVTLHSLAGGQLLGGNACYRRGIFQAGHWFDESILSGGDEAEFHARLSAAGYRMHYSPAFNVTHYADHRWRPLVKRAWRQGKARRAYGLGSPLPNKLYLRGLLSMASTQPASLPFSLIHFTVSGAAQWKERANLARGVAYLRDGEGQKHLPH